MKTFQTIMIFFLTWAQITAYFFLFVILLKAFYTTINKLCGKLSIISRAGWCTLLLVIPPLLFATAILFWEFLCMPAGDIINMYTKILTP